MIDRFSHPEQKFVGGYSGPHAHAWDMQLMYIPDTRSPSHFSSKVRWETYSSQNRKTTIQRRLHTNRVYETQYRLPNKPLIRLMASPESNFVKLEIADTRRLLGGTYSLTRAQYDKKTGVLYYLSMDTIQNDEKHIVTLTPFEDDDHSYKLWLYRQDNQNEYQQKHLQKLAITTNGQTKYAFGTSTTEYVTPDNNLAVKLSTKNQHTHMTLTTRERYSQAHAVVPNALPSHVCHSLSSEHIADYWAHNAEIFTDTNMEFTTIS